MPVKKKGALTREEIAYIREHHKTLSVTEISQALGRPFLVIDNFISGRRAPGRPRKGHEKPKVVVEGVRGELRKTVAWKRLKDEFDPDELEYFEERYEALLSQFRDDVLATEENQICKAIKYELLMSRNLIERKKLRKSIIALEKIQSNFMSRFSSPEEMSEVDKQDSMNMASQLSGMRAAEQSKYNEYTTLDSNHQKLMKDLKATRDQRLNRAADGKKTFLDLIKELSDNDVRERAGRQAARMHEAAKKEMSRLGKIHTFQDGLKDQPVLSADTIE